jgi:hypothetical protein
MSDYSLHPPSPALAPEEKAGQSSGDFVILGDANYLVY